LVKNLKDDAKGKRKGINRKKRWWKK
jgi:hypothetical protein